MLIHVENLKNVQKNAKEKKKMTMICFLINSLRFFSFHVISGILVYFTLFAHALEVQHCINTLVYCCVIYLFFFLVGGGCRVRKSVNTVPRGVSVKGYCS